MGSLGMMTLCCETEIQAGMLKLMEILEMMVVKIPVHEVLAYE
jgi:hypothetical protein